MKKKIPSLSSEVIQLIGWGTNFAMVKCRTTDIPEFQNYECKIAKDELFDYFICEFIFYYFFKITWTLKVFDNFSKL